MIVPFDQIDGEPVYDSLSALVPTLVVPTSETRDAQARYGGDASYQDWRTTLRTFGEILDREREADAYIDETEAQIAAMRDEHGELIDSISAVEMKSMSDWIAINMLSPEHGGWVLGTILMAELGFTPPEQVAALEPDQWGGYDLSTENIGLVESDLLFVEVRENSTLHSDSPVWATLEVVNNGNVFEVGNHWEFGGAVAARVVLADIDAALDQLAAQR